MTPEEQAKLLEEVEHEIERLNALYNQYFMGIEKIEPTVQAKNLERKIQILRKEQIRNTALRFRFQMLVQKLNTQSTYWRRICRQIEEGTYTRHVIRAQQRSGRPSAGPQEVEAQGREDRTWTLDDFDLESALGAELTGSDAGPPTPSPQPVANLDDPFDDLTDPETRSQQSFASAAAQGSFRNLLELDDPLDGAAPVPQSPPPPPKPEAPPTVAAPDDALRAFFHGKPPSAAREPVPRPRPQPQPQRSPDSIPGGKPAGGFDEERAKQVFKTYLAARQKTNESIDGLSFEKVRASLVKQHEAKGGKVDFKVVIRDGRAIIKAVSKE